MKDSASGIKQYFDQYLNSRPISGVFLMAEGDQVLFSGAWGMADQAQKIPNTLHTKFPVASLSKAITCMAILRLAENNHVSLHKPVNIYLPSFAQIRSDITLHHLMSHSSGLPDYQIGDEENLHEYFAVQRTSRELCRKFLNHPQVGEPGEKFHYSNPGYYLLGLVVEEVSGQSFEAFCQSMIFDPLKMRSTCMDDPAAMIPDRARPYEWVEGKYREAPCTDARNFYPQGGVVSTVNDLFVWGRSLVEEGLINRELQEKMFGKYACCSLERDIWYGYGWHILSMNNRKLIGHAGSHWGYCSHMEWYPDEELMVISLSNDSFQDVSKLVMDTAGIYFSEG